ncbi:MAG TPA: hypothetical protein VD788_02460, partial [Candidatus Polarisedimenticolaceae bacterium]|nr:hypothetical protein [Candidatus Polarisedimenticolaceae bacterium]
MTNGPRPRRAIVALLTLALCVAPARLAAGEAEADVPRTSIERWLVAGPAAHPLPIFADAERGGVEVSALLDQPMLNSTRIRPAEGQTLVWVDGKRLSFKPTKAGRQGRVDLPRPRAAGEPAVAWLAVHLRAARFAKLDLVLTGEHPRRVWLDGEPLASGEGETEVESKIELIRGSHTLLVETILDPAREADWKIGVDLVGDDTAALVATTDPRRELDLLDLLEAPEIGSIALSPDGTRIVASVSRVVPGTDESESWIEIRSAADGALEDSWRGQVQVRSVDWSPDGRFISYVTKAVDGGEDASTLFLYDVERRSAAPLLQSVEHLGRYLWSPTGGAIVFATTHKADKDERGVKLLGGLLDRWADYRDKQFLHLVTVPDGSRRLLTAGDTTTDPLDISPDGRRLLFTRRLEDLADRPFTRTELWQLDLRSFT